MWDILLETVGDLSKMFPFLFTTYLFIEFIEHKSSQNIERGLKKFGVFGGAILGCIPQCGFSIAASNLFSGGLITTGTLVAVFISTSDEAIPILLANLGNIDIILNVIIIKILFAIVAGIIADMFLNQRYVKSNAVKKSKNGDIKHMYIDINRSCNHGILKPAFMHTINVFAFIAITTFLLSTAIELIGEEKLSMLLLEDSIFQPAIASALGLIPNCAASVMLTQLYISGNISFGSVISGLSTGAGFGLIVLFKLNKNMIENIKIIAYIYVFATLVGILIQLFM